MSGNKRSWGGFTFVLMGISVIWLVILPQVGERPAVRQRIEILEDRGVDPGAMYYTDLEVMTEVKQRLTRLQREHPEAFWRPAFLSKDGP